MLIGVDAGGTSTRAVVVDSSGLCLGYGSAGGGNPVSWGPQRAAEAIRDAVAAALGGTVHDGGPSGDGGTVHDGGSAGGVRPMHEGQPVRDATVALAMAGASSYFAPGAIADELATIGLAASIRVESDLLATFCAGSPALDGYALVAGTGAAAIRVQGGQVRATADGLGWMLGDNGSGFWIGREVVRAATAAIDRRGPATALAPLLLAALDIPSDGQQNAYGRPMELQLAIDRLYRLQPVQMSRFAALAFQAAADDDEVAATILDGARGLLSDTLRAMVQPDVAGPVVLGGGIARRLPGLGSVLADVVMDQSGDRPDVALVSDGAVGAGVLALRAADIAVTDGIFDRMTTSIAERRPD